MYLDGQQTGRLNKDQSFSWWSRVVQIRFIYEQCHVVNYLCMLSLVYRCMCVTLSWLQNILKQTPNATLGTMCNI